MLTGHYVVPDDLHVSVTVRPGMLVPETNNVTQFVNNYAELVAIFPDADCLRTVPSLSHERAASDCWNRNYINNTVA